ncbi:MAG TPA: zinc-ribbon domain-containing protein, partial [Gemmatimonadales bacterium]|nr:zinc-ribbon domain-containing protein [Gemmatimonadales bacterium]
MSCPTCAAVFRVDPAKVPEAGVRARCSACGGIIPVRREAMVIEVPPAAAPAPVIPASPPPPPPPPPRQAEVPPVIAVPPPLAAPVVPLDALPAVEPPRAESAVAMPAPTVPPVESPPARPGNPFLHQSPSTRARRLARALVSDLVVYHPEKRQRGLNDGNLKELFAEEIRKSWEDSQEQVGEELATTTPYFTEALN